MSATDFRVIGQVVSGPLFDYDARPQPWPEPGMWVLWPDGEREFIPASGRVVDRASLQRWLDDGGR